MMHRDLHERLVIAGEVNDSTRARAAELRSRATLAIMNAESIGIERLIERPIRPLGRLHGGQPGY